MVLQIGVGSSLVLTPLTRLIVGTSIGSTAALVPLTLAAIPFFARIAETSLLEVDKGLVEAAQAMGCNYWQIIFKVLIPEAFPSLVLGGTILIVSLLNSSAMAGAVGGGGLGNLAIQYGYQRFDVGVMFSTIATLIVLVQIIQLVGDRLAQQMRKK
ncbi:MAG: methionine ABC transporter permease [Gloeotrichia echinulata DVL01]